MAVNNLHRSLALALRKEWYSGVNLVWEKGPVRLLERLWAAGQLIVAAALALSSTLKPEHTLVVICPLSTSKRGAATARTNEEPTGA